MKQNVTVVKDLAAVLKDMEPWVKNPKTLYSGNKPKNFSLLPREILGNWLMCTVGNALDDKAAWTFCTDPSGGDGILIDRNTDSQMVTEHVFVPQKYLKDSHGPEDVIKNAVAKKQAKGGKAYAEGKHLIVFCEGIGKWYPNRVGKAIAGTHNFASVWAVGLDRAENADTYYYWIAQFENSHCPVVEIKIDFDKVVWLVSGIQ